MKKYFWKGIDEFGKNQKGFCVSGSKEQLYEQLRNKGIAVLYEKEIKKTRITVFRKITLEQKVFFFSQLAILIDSGIELLLALEVVARQVKTTKLKNIIFQIIESVKVGDSFSIALQKHDFVFDSFMVHMIKAGEDSGRLALVLKNLSDYLSDRLTLENKLKKAALMPVITTVFAVLTILGVFIFVVPQFESLFNSFDKKIPESTQIILNVSSFLRTDKAIYLFIVFLFFIISMKILFQIKQIKKIKDIILLKLFYFNKIFLLQDLISYLQTNYIFLESGTNLDKALLYSSKTVKNSCFYQKTLLIKDLVSKGKTLEESLMQVGPKFFPENLVAVVSVGEQVGNLDVMLKKAVGFFGDELKKRLNFLTTIFQPVLLVFIGLLVAFLLLAIYLPIFEMASLF